VFERELNLLKRDHEHGCFEYPDSSMGFCQVARAHFEAVKREAKYGIYVVRRQLTGEVLYVGKAGMIRQDGQFKKQDIPGRLTNVKGKRTANEWSAALLNECGALTIEYVFLEAHPQSPALAEAMLLQAYLNEHGELPPRNKSL